jgi:hypothetical protein
MPASSSCAPVSRRAPEPARLAPTDPRPRLEQAGQLADSGRLPEALASVQAALAVEPNYRRARLLAIDLLGRLGRPGEAGVQAAALARTDAMLADYVPDSAYAAEIAADDPAQRARVGGLLAGPGKGAAGDPPQGTTR